MFNGSRKTHQGLFNLPPSSLKSYLSGSLSLFHGGGAVFLSIWGETDPTCPTKDNSASLRVQWIRGIPGLSFNQSSLGVSGEPHRKTGSECIAQRGETVWVGPKNAQVTECQPVCASHGRARAVRLCPSLPKWAFPRCTSVEGLT